MNSSEDSSESAIITEDAIDELLYPLRTHINTFKIPVDVQTVRIGTGTGPGGVTPLHIACRDGCESLLRYLLNQGADVHIRDNSGRSALHWLCNEVQARAQQRPLMMKKLLDMMSIEEIKHEDTAGQTAHDLAKVSDEHYLQRRKEGDNSGSRFLIGDTAFVWRYYGFCADFKKLHKGIEAHIYHVKREMSDEDRANAVLEYNDPG